MFPLPPTQYERGQLFAEQLIHTTRGCLSTSAINLSYRLDIDGLRAIAVLSVIAFHLGIQPVAGGFVGVDIFFVISGFVIYRNLMNDAVSGTFSVHEFYKKRIRRILPALLLVLLFSQLAGLLILTPKAYVDFSRTALASIFSVSNVYFYKHSGYFAPASVGLPLLNTWSLGVEEQFYLLVPLLFLGTRKTAGLTSVTRLLIIVSLITFIYNLVAIFLQNKFDGPYYLPMSRFWEIAVGGLLAVRERAHTEISPVRPQWNIVVGIVGLLGITASFFVFDSNTPYPGFAALLPVCSTAMLIFSGFTPQSTVSRWLTVKPLGFLGRISYSLYLFHWPMIVYTSLLLGRALQWNEKFLLFIAMLLMASLSWKYVEQPFRRRDEPMTWQRVKISLCLATFIIATLCVWVIRKDGFVERMNLKAQEVIRVQSSAHSDSPPCTPVARYNTIYKAQICSNFPEQAHFDYVLLGDSHAAMYISELNAGMLKAGKRGLSAIKLNCEPLLGVYTSKLKGKDDCTKLRQHILDIVRKESIPVVILSSRWARLYSPVPSPSDNKFSKKLFDAENHGTEISLYDALERTVRRFTDAGAQVVVVGPSPEIAFDVPDMLVRATNLGLNMPISYRRDFDVRQSIVLDALHRIEAMPRVSVVYPHERLCDQDVCTVYQGPEAYYYDSDHLSAYGARKIVPDIVRAASPLMQ